jgi:protein-tyrosine-phosphatase
VIVANGLAKSALKGRVSVSSGGISVRNREPATQCAIQIAKELGLDLKKHRARAVSQRMLDKNDLILCMTAAHKLHLLHNFENLFEKCFTLAECTSSQEISDPYGGSIDAYRKIATNIQNLLPNLLEFLRKFFHEDLDR